MLMKTTMIAFLGAFLCLDRVCLQLMISRPIVTAPIIGLILGDVKTGLIIGAFLELFWIDRPPLGNYIPPNDSLMAVFITSATILAGDRLGDVSRSLIALSFLLFLPLSYLTQKIDGYIAASNNKRSNDALEDAKKGDIAGIEKKHVMALFKTYVIFAVFIFFFTILGMSALAYLNPQLPSSAIEALTLVYFAFPILVVAVALHSIKMRGDMAIFSAIFIATTILLEIFYGL
jgi:mannose/fructose/N-acetylgalactosamine-specific phosphotransferase system component IIC